MDPHPQPADFSQSPDVSAPGDHKAGASVRVAFFSDSLPERNGTGAYYHDLSGQLAPEVEALELFQPLDMRRHPRLSIPMPGDPMQRLYTPNVFRIRRAFRALRPNIVVSVTPGPFGLLGMRYARRRGLPFVTAFHTDFEQLARIYWNPVSRTFAGAFLRAFNRFMCKRSVTVLVNNSQLRKDVAALGAPDSEVMGTPIPPEFLRQAPKPPPERVRQICFAGRLAEEKNIDRIIAAAARFPDIRFVIGGEGPLRRSLEEAAEALSNVRFTGWLSRKALIELLDESSFLLLPSRIETFGSVALEAMARGRPALVSANAGIHDWSNLADGLFSLREDESLADAIARLLQLPPESWREKAELARAAAGNLNHATIRQWGEVLGKHIS